MENEVREIKRLIVGGKATFSFKEPGSHLLTTGLPNSLAVGMLSYGSHRAKATTICLYSFTRHCARNPIGGCTWCPRGSHAKARVRITPRVG